jgi:hypothetical protein
VRGVQEVGFRLSAKEDGVSTVRDSEWVLVCTYRYHTLPTVGTDG